MPKSMFDGLTLADLDAEDTKQKGMFDGLTLDDIGVKVNTASASNEGRTFGNMMQDAGVAALKTAVALPETAIGIADIPTFGYAGKLAEAIGVRTKDANAILDTWYSNATKDAKQQFHDAKGFAGKLAVVRDNPYSLIGTTVIESASSMIGAAAIGRFAKWAGVGSDAVAAALGEGVVSGGQTAEQIRQESEDGTLSLAQNALAVGSGALTGVIGAKVNKLADKMGINTAEMALMRGGKAGDATDLIKAAEKGFIRKTSEGAVVEGAQEVLQSGQEQVANNLGTGKPWSKDVDESMILGGFAGVATGAGAAHMRRSQPNEAPTGPSTSQTLAASAFANIGGADGTATGEAQKSYQHMIVASLSQMSEQEKSQAIKHLAGNDTELAAKIAAAVGDSTAVDSGWSHVDTGSNLMGEDGKSGFLKIHNQIRMDSGLLSGIKEPSATQAADIANQQLFAGQEQQQQGNLQAQPMSQQDVNTTGHVSEPLVDRLAQLQAVRDGRKPAFFTSPEDAAGMDFNGLHVAELVDPTGKRAFIASKDQATVQQAAQRAKEVGVDQAAGEALGYADPTLTTATRPDAVVAQHLDAAGNVVQDQLVTPESAPGIKPIDGTTLRMTRHESAFADRINKLAEEQHQQLLNESQQQPEVVEQPQTTAVKGDFGRLINAMQGGGADIDHSTIRNVQAPNKTLSRLAKAINLAFGTKVQFFDAAEGGVKRVDGSTVVLANGIALRSKNGNAIFLNASLANESTHTQVLNVLGHELAHVLQSVAPDVYTRMERIALTRVSHDRAVRHREALMKAFSDEGGTGKYSERIQEVRDELVAETIGEMCQDPSFWKEAFGVIGMDKSRSHTLFTKITDALTKAAKAFTRTGFIQGLNDLKAVRKAVTEAYLHWSLMEENAAKRDAYDDRLSDRQTTEMMRSPAEATHEVTKNDKAETAKVESEKDAAARKEWKKKQDKLAAVEPTEPHIPAMSYVDNIAKAEAKIKEWEAKDAKTAQEKAEKAEALAKSRKERDDAVAAEKAERKAEREKAAADRQAEAEADADMKQIIAEAAAQDKADRLAAKEKADAEKAAAKTAKPKVIKSAADVQQLKKAVAEEKATQTTAVEQPAATEPETVESLKKQIDAVLDEVNAVKQQAMSLLSKSGRVPNEGTAKRKEYDALREKESDLIQNKFAPLDYKHSKLKAEAAKAKEAADPYDVEFAKVINQHQGKSLEELESLLNQADEAREKARRASSDLLTDKLRPENAGKQEELEAAFQKSLEDGAILGARKFAFEKLVKDAKEAIENAPEPVTLIEKKKVVVKSNPDNNHTLLKFSDGTKLRVQRLNSTESMGLPGWHDMDAVSTHPGMPPLSYKSDTLEQVISEALQEKNKPAKDSVRLSRDLVNDGSEIGAADDSNVAPDVIHGRNGVVSQNDRWKGGAKAGEYIGAPAAYNTPGKIVKLRRIFRELAKEGVRGRFWYEESGKSVLRFVGGNPVEARKFISLLAIYSPQAKVNANTTMALSAWEQYKAGVPIDTKTELQDGMATDVLYNNKQWGGEKTNNFYKNLMREVDLAVGHPSKQGATIDMWMMRAAGYDSDAPTAAQYKFVENENNRLAKELGWEPQQVQAAIWTAIKARTENKGVKERTEAKSTKKGFMEMVMGAKGKLVRQINDAAKHRAIWLKEAFDHTVTTEDTTAAAYHFGTALDERSAQLSWEATPGASTDVLPGIHSAPMSQQQEYLRDIQDALLDKDGADIIDKFVGLLVNQGLTGYSGWKGELSTGVQQNAPVYIKGGSVSQLSRSAIELALSIRGLALHQEGMAWHMPIWGGPKYENNGVEFNIGRKLNSQETAVLYKALSNELGHTFAPPIPTSSGFRVLNFPKTKFLNMADVKTKLRIKRIRKVGKKRNDAFHKAVGRAVAQQAWFDEVQDRAHFQSDGNLIENDWSKNDSDYRSRIAEAYGALGNNNQSGGTKRPDIFKWIDNELLPRVTRVNEHYSEKYGWGEPTSVRFSRVGVEAALGLAEPAGRPGEVPGGGVGESIQSAIHYGREGNLSHLSGHRFGSGIRGAEQERLNAPGVDRRIKSRVYFYLPVAGGIPSPEQGLGGHVYTSDLSNLYDPSSAKIIGVGVTDGEKFNNFESKVLDAGYKGYLNKEQGTAVVLNADSHPVRYLGSASEFTKVQRQIQRIQQKNQTRTEGDESVRKTESNQFFTPKQNAAVKEVAPSFRMEYGYARVKANEMEAANAVLQDMGHNFRFARDLSGVPISIDVDGANLKIKDTQEAIDTLKSKIAKYSELLACLR